MADTQSNHFKGLLLTSFGRLALTVDIPLIKLADRNHWLILMMRRGMISVATIVI